VSFFARPETFEQLEVSKELFGKAAAYLKGLTEYSLRPKITVVLASRETTLIKYILKNINTYDT
jgi:hypothetical protein